MIKIQTIIMKKSGSEWNTHFEVVDELSKTIIDNGYSSDSVGDWFEQVILYGWNYKSQLNVETQTYTEIRRWDIEKYEKYKNDISNYENDINNILAQAGWDITETVETILETSDVIT